MPSNKFTCVDCGGPVTSQQAPAKAAAMRCHPCRRLKRVKPCAYCGNTFVWPDSHPRKYCSKQCLSQSMQIRPPDDIRVRRTRTQPRPTVQAPRQTNSPRPQVRVLPSTSRHHRPRCAPSKRRHQLRRQPSRLLQILQQLQVRQHHHGMAHRPTTTPHDNSSGMAQPPSSATQGQARTNRTQLPYMRDTNHPNQVLHHRLRRRSPSPLHTRPIPHQSRAATPTTQTHQHRTLTTDTTT